MNNFNKVLLNRKELYGEIWKLSVAGVAKKYNLHYAKLINSLKENNIPYPSSGYWTRLACGKDVTSEVIPLPEAEMEDIYLYTEGYFGIRRNQGGEKVVKSKRLESLEISEEDGLNNNAGSPLFFDNAILPFLEGEERFKVFETIANIQIELAPRLHPVLMKYKKSVDEWKQQEKESKYNLKRSYYNYSKGKRIEQPAFLNEVSEEGLSRLMVILDSLYKAIERLGGVINPDLSMKIRSDIVRVDFAESQDKKEHDLTKQEAKEMLEYKENLKLHRYASKPQIRKYDYSYNGKLRIKFDNGKYIKDNDKKKLENYLDEILVQLYELSEERRIVREKREQEHQNYLDEKRRREEWEERIREEKSKTQALANEAKDYRIASEIRSYIQAILDEGELTKEKREWIKWATDKADWYDPVIAREDAYLGKRKHADSGEEKQLKNEVRRGSYGW